MLEQIFLTSKLETQRGLHVVVLAPMEMSDLQIHSVLLDSNLHWPTATRKLALDLSQEVALQTHLI